jgi:predicted HicB family RNase H-like nuclease
MKTTLLLDDEIHRQAKQAAARLGIPLTRFIEEAIRLRKSFLARIELIASPSG